MNYLIFLGVLSADCILAATSVNQADHRTVRTQSSFFTFLEVWVLVMTLWFLFEEFFDFKRYCLLNGFRTRVQKLVSIAKAI